MNNSDIKLITDLAEQLKAMTSPKDIEADQCIQRYIASQPDAVYKLVQLTLIQHMAVEQLKAVQTAVPPTPPKGFLDDLKEKLFGKDNASAQPNSAANPNANTAASSGFLRQAMTVGTGVAGGMMMANALESLFNRNNTGSGFSQPNEVIENNYYNTSSENPDINTDNNNNFDDTDTDNDFDGSGFDDNGNFD